MNTSLYKQEMEQELDSILAYWMQYTVDHERGGFFGKVNNDNEADAHAEKGLVMNARILWAFSSAFNLTGTTDYLTIADRAYAYITDHFIDTEHGGVYWSVDAEGKMLSDRKQVYGQAFCLYALAEYYQATSVHAALEHAVRLFNLIEQHSFDPERLGYFEAFNRDWSPIDDLRLSARDANEKKTMNTHLHVIEAYANLYKVLPLPQVKERIEDLLEVFDQHIIDPSTHHLVLFFDENWAVKSPLVSYGHDIEAAWLLQEAAEIIGEEKWITKMKEWAIKIADAAGEGLDDDDGLWYEYDPGADHLVKEKHSWPQAEAMIGFVNAWQVSGKEKYYKASYASWEFVKEYIRDNKQGEWFWGVNDDYSPMAGQDKAGFWKCPYHNSRACIEIIRRLN
ncbi:AGE family epimerase/isomerase [uncultured Chitinophaga sp.]|uniref:AGE family epimerase/isomerase n=1 Tax=uncultured Chitinophaga sp. TaxID=339340 RepID=UPI0025EC0BF2|nr:AGE family epimerase/isomerase [uncultured Chitinophaga sp.]